MIYLPDDDAFQIAEKRLLDMIMPPLPGDENATAERTREKLLVKLREGKLDDRMLELTIRDNRSLQERADELFAEPQSLTTEQVGEGVAPQFIRKLRSFERREKVTVKVALDRLYAQERSLREFAEGFEEGIFQSDEPSAQVKLFHQGFLELIRTNPKQIYQLSHRQFEEFILELLLKYGLHAELTAKTRDGGCDIIAVNTDNLGIRTKYVIEAKHYRPPNKVDVNVVRQVNTVRIKEQGHHGVIVTSSFFTKDAIRENARYYGLDLRDFERLSEWINKAPA